MRAGLTVVVLAACLAAVAVRPGAAQETAELPVRAAFVYNFTKFIDWPPAALPPDAFRICVVGDARFARALDEIIAGERAHGRPLLRVDPPTSEAARDCQILYIGRQEAARGNRLLAAVRQLPVLTVGDRPRFLEQGGAVRFLLERDRVRFDMNTAALDEAGLSVSSKLLRVARRVESVRR